VPDDSAKLDQVIRPLPTLFSDKFVNVMGMVCHLDSTDSIPVRSSPYQCSPPLRILREIVQDLVVEICERIRSDWTLGFASRALQVQGLPY
jgi:hypothetical protein